MGPSRRQPSRADRAFARLYRRHAGGVYRYSLAVLQSPASAEHATREAFLDARRELERGDPPGGAQARLWALVQRACSRRAHAAGADGAPLPPPGEPACAEAELRISRHLDGRLPRPERRLLRAHLRGCVDCACFRRRQELQRAAIRALAAAPFPAALAAHGRRDVSCDNVAADERSRMGIVNRRNAVVGWAAIKIGKKVAKQKAKDVVPGTVGDGRRPNSSAIAMALASVGGALLFWRKRRGDDGDEGS